MTQFSGDIISIASIKPALNGLEPGQFLIVVDSEPKQIANSCWHTGNRLKRKFSYSSFRGGVKVKRVV